jgi:nucleoside-diphosphate-sugar epimerase
MKVLITGGAGFLGLNIARQIVIRDGLIGASGEREPVETIVLFDITKPAERPCGLDERVIFETGDISNRATVDKLVDRDNILIFHLASVVSAGGEKDFDLAMRVNLTGMLNVLEATRARTGTPRIVFASSAAVFGGDGMPDPVADATKQTPQTTYGVTKTIGELLINDYSRKGFIDGRSARLPNIIIRPGLPNAAASSFCSGIFREPLNGEPFAVPVATDTLLPLLGYRNCVQSFIHLAELDASQFGDDRAMCLRNASYTVNEMIECLEQVANRNGIALGKITRSHDPMIAQIIAGWPTKIDSSRAEKLGFPEDASLERVIQDFIDDFMTGLAKPAS